MAASAASADDPQRNYDEANMTKQERESSWVAASAASADDPQREVAASAASHLRMADEEEEGNVFMELLTGGSFSVAYKHAEESGS